MPEARLLAREESAVRALESVVKKYMQYKILLQNTERILFTKIKNLSLLGAEITAQNERPVPEKRPFKTITTLEYSRLSVHHICIIEREKERDRESNSTYRRE